MLTNRISNPIDHMSPAGAEIRCVLSNELGGLAHCTLKSGKTSRPVTHKTVSEFWHVISGRGEIWRRQTGKELITTLEAGVAIDIPLGTDFQYRCNGNLDLVFLCVTMPPWSGNDEAKYLDSGAWTPT